MNQVGVFLGMRTVAPLMVERGSGSIINLSSVAGLMGIAVPDRVRGEQVGGARHDEVRGQARSPPAGVRVNSLHPGQIDTDMNTRQRERTPELIDKLVAAIPMRRIGDPMEMADAAVFLAADESRYVTGSEVVVDGGVSG